MARHKSRVKWLREGDNNTKFFHKTLSRRNIINSAASVGVDGVTSDNPKLIKDSIKDYFKVHFEDCMGRILSLDDSHFNKLSFEQKVGLEKVFSQKEIKLVVFEGDDDKAPGPDGFNIFFVRNNWEVLKKDICCFLEDFFHTRSFQKSINASFLTPQS